jgi:hypothetical protein
MASIVNPDAVGTGGSANLGMSSKGLRSIDWACSTQTASNRTKSKAEDLI